MRSSVSRTPSLPLVCVMKARPLHRRRERDGREEEVREERDVAKCIPPGGGCTGRVRDFQNGLDIAFGPKHSALWGGEEQREGAHERTGEPQRTR